MLMKAVEARKKAEVVEMHTNKCTKTHTNTVHSIKIKRSQVIVPWMVPCFHSFLCSLFLHSFFCCTLTKSKDSGPQALFFECTAVFG